jgi:hypothetical protein
MSVSYKHHLSVLSRFRIQSESVDEHTVATELPLAKTKKSSKYDLRI